MEKNIEQILIENIQNASKPTIRLAGVLHDSITDGPGLRFVVFTQGCPHHCQGCHNPETWNFEGGALWSTEEILEELKSNPIIKGVTFSGGEPLAQADKMLHLVSEMKKQGYEIACYSGYTFENAIKNEICKEFLNYVDVMVDGPFVLSERSLALKFKGSKNQRMINVQESLKAGKAILCEDERWI